jgi:hypothetical protein
MLNIEYWIIKDLIWSLLSNTEIYITSFMRKLLSVKIKGYKARIQVALIGRGHSELLTKIISNLKNVGLYKLCRIGSLRNIQVSSMYEVLSFKEQRVFRLMSFVTL